MRKIINTIALFCLLVPIIAQVNNNYKRMYEIADDYVFKKNYIDALEYFKKLYEMDTNNSNIQFYLGRCYLESYSEKEKAIKYLELASQNISTDYYGKFNEKSAPVFTYYYLGKAYFLQYKFEEAIENFQKFKYYLTNEDKDLIDDVNRQIEMAYNAKKIIAAPIEVELTNLGSVVNSKFPDYAPVMSPDKNFIIFTSRRDGSTGDKKDEKGKFFEDIYVANYDEKNNVFSDLRQLPGNVNTSGHEASISVSWDGNSLFIYRDDKGDGNIYLSQKENNEWGAAEKLGNGINTKFYENHACLSPDGETLYFVSDRPGGFGGKDIWKAQRKAKNKWANITNLGPKINTKYDEESPVILADGKTLYFSSKGHECIGGFDIFFSYLDNNEWTTPRNIGYPLNTVYDDIFFVPTLDGKEAFYATDIQSGFGDLDIYKVIINNQNDQIAILNGHVKDTVLNKPIRSRVTIYDYENNKIYSETESDEISGEFSTSLKAGKKYKILVVAENGYQKEDILEVPAKKSDDMLFSKPYFFGKIVTQLPDTILERINVGQRIGDRFVLRNVFFDFDKSTLRPESKTELDRLVSLLNKLPGIMIELSGHTDNYGSLQYNKRLSNDRALAVVNYLVEYGIDKNRLSYAGYGFDQPIATNESDAGRQLNRRTEFKLSNRSFAENLQQATNAYKDASKYADVLIDYKPKWYIIGGSFTFLKKAEQFRDELRAKGFSEAQIVGQNSTGSFRVAYKGFYTKAEAQKALIELKSSNDAGLWLLQK